MSALIGTDVALHIMLLLLLSIRSTKRDDQLHDIADYNPTKFEKFTEQLGGDIIISFMGASTIFIFRANMHYALFIIWW